MLQSFGQRRDGGCRQSTLKAGHLPAGKKLYGGHGNGLRSARAISGSSRRRSSASLMLPDQGTFRFHVGCLALWEGELMKWGWLKRD